MKRTRNLSSRLALIICAFIAFLGIVFCISRGTQKAGGEYPSDVLGFKIQTTLAPEGGDNRPQITRKIKYIVIHETDNFAATATAKAHANLQSSGGEGKTSWHYTVDENEGYHSIPDDEIAWHAGDGRDGDGNKHGIGVELCVNEGADFDKTFDNGAKLAGFLMNAYNIPAENIRQHCDFSGKNCPASIRKNGTFEDFRALATKYAEQLKTK